MMRVGAALVGAMLVIGGAGADAEPAEQAARHEYLAQLKKARALVEAKRWTAARAAFAVLLAREPDDSLALSEAGLVAMHAGDLDEAARLLELAATRPALLRFRAAAYYNLGLVRTRREDKAGAIDSYRRSLTLRDDRTVENALLALDPTAKEAFRGMPRPFTATPERTDDLRALLLRRLPRLFNEAFALEETPAAEVKRKYSCERISLTIDVSDTQLTDVQVWQCGGRDPEDHHWLRIFDLVAARTEEGWYVQPVAAYWENKWDAGGDLRVLDVVRAQISGRTALVLRSEVRSEHCNASYDTDPDAFEGNGDVWTGITLLGVGPSGAPSISPGISTRHELRVGSDCDRPKHDERPSAIASLAVRYPATGGLELVGPKVEVHGAKKQSTKYLAAELRPGRVPVTFP